LTLGLVGAYGTGVGHDEGECAIEGDRRVDRDDSEVWRGFHLVLGEGLTGLDGTYAGVGDVEESGWVELREKGRD
jgi:hypothetical protein